MLVKSDGNIQHVGDCYAMYVMGYVINVASQVVNYLEISIKYMSLHPPEEVKSSHLSRVLYVFSVVSGEQRTAWTDKELGDVVFVPLPQKEDKLTKNPDHTALLLFAQLLPTDERFQH